MTYTYMHALNCSGTLSLICLLKLYILTFERVFFADRSSGRLIAKGALIILYTTW